MFKFNALETHTGNRASYPTELESLAVLLWHCYLNSKLLLPCHFTNQPYQ